MLRWRCRCPLPGIAARDGTGARDGDIRRVGQSRSCPYADVNSAEPIGIARRATSEGTQFTQIADEFGILRERYWGQHLWARGYWVASSGNVTDEVWVEYIKNQTPPVPDDNFTVI